MRSDEAETATFLWPYADLQVEISLISVLSTVTEPMPILPGDTLQLEIQQSPGILPEVRRVRWRFWPRGLRC